VARRPFACLIVFAAFTVASIALAADTDASLERYATPGPYSVTLRADREIVYAPGERIAADVYVSAVNDRAPLVVFVHGHESSKRAHALQAAHLASWGLHALALDVPSTGPWARNGRIVARVISAIHRNPRLVEANVDTACIVVVGYSFGALAAAVALGERAPAAAAILLDPAAAANDVPLLRRVEKPVMIIGADDDELTARNRDYFFEYLRGPVGEVSVRDADHDDAQFPSDLVGDAPEPPNEARITFVSALTASALSFASTAAFESAWRVFAPALATGKLFNAKKK
jgi:dienelactone hydrolase